MTDQNNVDLRKANTKIWLVKVPHFLASAWEEASYSDNVDLGFIKIDDKIGKPKFAVTAIKPANSMTEIAKEYDMTVVDADSVMKVFSEDTSGNIAFEGVVEMKCDIKPKITDEYKKIMKNRNEKAQKKNRFIQTLDSRQQTQNYSKRPTKRKGDSPERPEKEKSERIEKNKLLDLIFNAFENREYWTFRELVTCTKQPMTYLKEILNEVCDYNKRGPHKSYYQLKEHLKGTKTSQSAEPTTNQLEKSL